MKTKIIKGIKIISAIIILFITIVVVINTSPFDEKLRPEVVKILEKPNYPQVEDNAYFALMGLQAEKGKNINITGHQLIQRYIDNQANNNDSLLDSDYEEILGSQLKISPKLRDVLDSCDSKVRTDCLNDFSQNFNEEIMEDTNSSVLLERYSHITEMKYYHNFNDGGPGLPLPSFSPLMKLSQLHLVNTYKNKSSKEFIQELLKDMIFWKKMLKQGTLLIDRLVALNGIRKDLVYLSEFIRNHQIDEQLLTEIDSILMSLTPEEIDLSKSFISESKLMFNFGDLIEKDLSFVEGLLFQPKATANYHYQINLKSQLEWSAMPLDKFIKNRTSKKEYQDFSRLEFHYLYNFIGKYLTEISAPAIDDYVARTYDVNNMFKLVKIQLQMKLSESQNIQEILAKPENSNPFTGKPFDYDNEKELIKFDCLDTFRVCEIKI